MDELRIGSRHHVWINPFCDDVQAEVVSYDWVGRPIMRTCDKDKQTLEPSEYVFPIPTARVSLEAVEKVFKEVHGEDL